MNNKINSIILRYLCIVIVTLHVLYAGLNNIFYTVFTPLTLEPLSFILTKVYGSGIVEGSILYLKGTVAEVAPACIAGAAYFILTILVLSSPSKKKTYLYGLLFLYSSFLVLNLLRIFLFSVWLAEGISYFKEAHLVMWYLGSTLLVALLWISNVRIFKVDSTPFYTDLLTLQSIRKGQHNVY